MTSLKNAVRKFAADESGATMVEYAVMIALIAAVCIVIIQSIGTKANTAFTSVNAKL